MKKDVFLHLHSSHCDDKISTFSVVFKMITADIAEGTRVGKSFSTHGHGSGQLVLGIVIVDRRRLNAERARADV